MSTFSLQEALAFIPYAVRGALNQYNACVLLPNSPTPFVAGSFADLDFALQYAQDAALDFQRCPHVRANRALTNKELSGFTPAQLRARVRFLASGWARFSPSRIASERARIKHLETKAGKTRAVQSAEANAAFRKLMRDQRAARIQRAFARDLASFGALAVVSTSEAGVP